MKKKDKKYICLICFYKWTSKKSFGEPSICPNQKCRSYDIHKGSTEKSAKRVIRNRQVIKYKKLIQYT